jgi:hypothetical protein
VKRGVHPTGNGRATTPERSAADVEPPGIPGALAQLEREIPALLRTAIERAKKGKPATLLRSVHRILRDVQSMVLEAKQHDPREWQELARAGTLTRFEASFLLTLLRTLRGTRKPATPLTAAQQRAAAEQQAADLRERTERLAVAPALEEPPPPPAPWTGGDRRDPARRMFHPGRKERRRTPHGILAAPAAHR